MPEFFTFDVLAAFLQVVLIDLVLAGDNAIVIGLAAAGLPKDQRSKAILIGIIAATLLRIVFASVTTQLLQIVGLLLAGGILLLVGVLENVARAAYVAPGGTRCQRCRPASIGTDKAVPRKTFARPRRRSSSPTFRCRSTTCWPLPAPRASIRDILIFGLVLSIALMGVAATFIARLLQRHRWIAYVGLPSFSTSRST